MKLFCLGMCVYWGGGVLKRPNYANARAHRKISKSDQDPSAPPSPETTFAVVLLLAQFSWVRLQARCVSALMSVLVERNRCHPSPRFRWKAWYFAFACDGVADERHLAGNFCAASGVAVGGDTFRIRVYNRMHARRVVCKRKAAKCRRWPVVRKNGTNLPKNTKPYRLVSELTHTRTWRCSLCERLQRFHVEHKGDNTDTRHAFLAHSRSSDEIYLEQCVFGTCFSNVRNKQRPLSCEVETAACMPTANAVKQMANLSLNSFSFLAGNTREVQPDGGHGEGDADTVHQWDCPSTAKIQTDTDNSEPVSFPTERTSLTMSADWWRVVCAHQRSQHCCSSRICGTKTKILP